LDRPDRKEKHNKSNKLKNNSRQPGQENHNEATCIHIYLANLRPTIRLGLSKSGVLDGGPSSLTVSTSAEGPEAKVPARVGRGVTRNPDKRLARVGSAGVAAVVTGLTGLRDRARATVVVGDGARVSGPADAARSDTAFRPRRLTAVARGKCTGVGAVVEEGKVGREEPAREAAAELKTLGRGATAAGGKRK
jgi:hypothetical protein